MREGWYMYSKLKRMLLEVCGCKLLGGFEDSSTVIDSTANFKPVSCHWNGYVMFFAGAFLKHLFDVTPSGHQVMKLTSSSRFNFTWLSYD